jgi:hypothetical protein
VDLCLTRSERTQRASQLLELLLTLFRSLLLIPNALPNSRLAYLVHLHDNMVVRYVYQSCLQFFPVVVVLWCILTARLAYTPSHGNLCVCVCVCVCVKLVVWEIPNGRTLECEVMVDGDGGWEVF